MKSRTTAGTQEEKISPRKLKGITPPIHLQLLLLLLKIVAAAVI